VQVTSRSKIGEGGGTSTRLTDLSVVTKGTYLAFLLPSPLQTHFTVEALSCALCSPASLRLQPLFSRRTHNVRTRTCILVTNNTSTQPPTSLAHLLSSLKGKTLQHRRAQYRRVRETTFLLLLIRSLSSEELELPHRLEPGSRREQLLAEQRPLKPLSVLVLVLVVVLRLLGRELRLGWELRTVEVGRMQE